MFVFVFVFVWIADVFVSPVLCCYPSPAKNYGLTDPLQVVLVMALLAGLKYRSTTAMAFVASTRAGKDRW
jgi:hypothetical protein